MKKMVSILLTFLFVVSVPIGTYYAQTAGSILPYSNAATGTMQTATAADADGAVENDLDTTPSDASVSDMAEKDISSEVGIVINADRTVTLTGSGLNDAAVWYLFSEYGKEFPEADILNAGNKKQCLNLIDNTETVNPADSGYAYRPFRIYAWEERNGMPAGDFASKDCLAVISISVAEAEALTGISAADEGITYKKGEVIVAYRKGTTRTDAELSANLSASVGTTEINGDTLLAAEISGETLVDDTGNEPMAVLQVEKGKKVVQAVAELLQNPEVKFAQPNYLYGFSDIGNEATETVGGDSAAGDSFNVQSTTVNDPYATSSNAYYQWQLERYDSSSEKTLGADCFDAWDVVRCGNSANPVGVAVLDTGCRVSHEDLKDNIAGAYNAFNAEENTGSTSDVTDNVGHGTHVCGIISARTNNGIGGSGVSYNAKIIPVKICDDSSGYSISESTAILGYEYVIANAKKYNIRVINNSWGGEDSETYVDTGKEWKDLALMKQIDAANEAGILTVCAAGNSYKVMPYVNYPSDYPTCVSVINLERAKDSDGRYLAERYSVNSGSNYNLPDHQVKNISAPGTDIWSTGNSNDRGYRLDTGTSIASPVVAGVAALVFTANEMLSPDECKSILYDTARDLVYSRGSENATEGWDVYTGYGEVDAAAAVKAASGYPEIAVSFETNGGSHVDTKYVYYKGKITKPADPVKSGYDFSGWYSNKALKQGWDFDNDTVTKSIKLYAKWTPVSYAISYDLAGGNLAAGTANPETYNIETASFMLKNPVKSGYMFKGWSGTALTGTENTTVTVSKGSTGARAYTANWTEQNAGRTLPVSFETNGGSHIAVQYVNYKGKISKPGNPVKSGYDFSGWYGDETLTTVWDFDNDTVTESIELYAKWIPVSYAISYDLAGGNPAAGTANPETYNIETASFTLKNPVKNGYIFKGWSGTDLKGAENTTVTVPKGSTGARVYTAGWTRHYSGGSFSDGGGFYRGVIAYGGSRWVSVIVAATATVPAHIVWKLRYANGGYAANTWEKVNGDWYYFDADGNMMTGSVTVGNAVYYLNPANGAMMSGWVRIGTDWYYFMDAAHATAAQPYGSLVRNGKTPDGYTVDRNGRYVGF